MNFTTPAPHLVEISCEDQVGNISKTAIKFPPIVTFDQANQPLQKEYKTDQEFRFSVYSPSNEPIAAVTVENASLVGCRDYE